MRKLLVAFKAYWGMMPLLLLMVFAPQSMLAWQPSAAETAKSARETLRYALRDKGKNENNESYRKLLDDLEDNRASEVELRHATHEACVLIAKLYASDVGNTSETSAQTGTGLPVRALGEHDGSKAGWWTKPDLPLIFSLIAVALALSGIFVSYRLTRRLLKRAGLL